MISDTAVVRCGVIAQETSVALPDPTMRIRMKRLNDLPVFVSFETGVLPADLETLSRLASGEIPPEEGVIALPRDEWFDTGVAPRAGTFYWAVPQKGAGFSLEWWVPSNAGAVTAYNNGGGIGGFGS